MKHSFYADKLIAAGLKPILPNDADRPKTHRIIYDEPVKMQKP